MKIFDTKARFDESKRFIGVFHQANRPVLDSDFNEEVRIRTTDAWRRTADLAQGSPDAGFQISQHLLLDPITSTAGWTGDRLPPDDQRHIRPELVLDRREAAGLPFVVRSHGHPAVRRVLARGALDLTAVPAGPTGTPGFAAAALVLPVRFQVPSNDQDTPNIVILFTRADGSEVRILAGLGTTLPEQWTELRVPFSDLQLAGAATITGFGLDGIPPRAQVWIDALRAEATGLGRNDFVIRGGDGTASGAGRMLGEGFRSYIESDRRYAFQPDFPEAPTLMSLLPGGPPASGVPPEDGHFQIYLDLWHHTVVALEDDFLIETALDGLDTTARQRLVSQVKARWIGPGASEALPGPTGGGALTTLFDASDGRPLRYPPEAVDTCRDRCLFTESIATGTGYRGTDNVHVRVEVFAVGGRPAVLVSRENGALLVPLLSNVPAGATILKVSPEEAGKLTVGDLVVIEDKVTRLQPEGPRLPELRRLRAVEAATGTIEVEAAGVGTGLAADLLPVGGPLIGAWTTASGASLRRWDLADWLAVDTRYNLADGIEFALAGAPADYRVGDHWTFVARIHDPDGRAQGIVETLINVPPHGPVHHVVPLARISEQAGVRSFEDLRPRFLPLTQVRDRLLELERQDARGAFAIVVGDVEQNPGELNQDTAEGITADEVLQDALRRLGPTGGTIYVRAGTYTLERPVILSGLSQVRIIGDGDGTRLLSVGAGGAFVLDSCGADGQVSIEDLAIIEDPTLRAVIGEGPVGPAEPEPDDPPLTLDDLGGAGPAGDPGSALGATLKALLPGRGRAMGSFLATLDRLRRIQKLNQGTEIENLPEAVALLDVLRRLPHGVVTIADSRTVSVRNCFLQSHEPLPLSAGVFITGSCQEIQIAGSRLVAATGVVGAPLSAFLSESFLVRSPLAALAVDGLLIEGNLISGSGQAVHGVHVADGSLQGVEIRQNHITGYAIGVLLDDQVELRASAAADRLVVADNRVIDSRLVAIQVAGDGVDVAGNEIRNALSENLLESAGLFHAGVQVAGQGIRVRESWIVVPPTPNAPVLGVCAAIVVGDGMDDGRGTSRGIFDVEVADNRIEGSGASTLAAGVLLGGSQPVFDVRVRGNVIRNLGDAGVRVLGGTVATGRLRIEDNRIEQVALAEVPALDLDIKKQLDLLGETLPAEIEALSRPALLLEALLAAPGNQNRAGLDAVLRWLERLTLRGAIVLSRLEEGEITGNRVAGVGRFETLVEARALGAEVRTAGVALVGGRDLVVTDNHVAEVRAPAVMRTPEVTAAEGVQPPVFAALNALSVSSPKASSTTLPSDLVSGADLHAAVTALHRLLLQYNRQIDRRVVLGRRIYGALDAVARAVDAQAPEMATLARTLEGMSALMRSTQNQDRHTETANSLRAILAYIARTTAIAPASTGAWKAIEDLETAIAGKTPAPKVVAVAAVLKADATLLAGVPDVRREATLAAINRMGDGGAQDAALATVDLLSWVALFRDEQARSGSGGVVRQPLGVRKDILLSLASNLKASSQTLANSSDRLGLLATMRGQTKALTQTLRESGSPLDAHLESDFRALDRLTAPTSAETVQRLQETLDRITTFTRAGGDGAGAPTDKDGEAMVRVATSRGDVALRLLVTDFLDSQVGRLQGLVDVSTPVVEAGLGVLQASMFQLQGHVEEDNELRPLAVATMVAIHEAINASPLNRAGKLIDVRQRLRKIADPARQLGVVTPDPTGPEVVAAPADQIARRLAGLGALLLTLRDLGPGQTPPRLKAVDLLDLHLARVLEETGQGNVVRQGAADALATAKPILRGEFGAGGVSAEEQLRKSLLALAVVLDDVASDASDDADDPEALAAATLVHAVRLALESTAAAQLKVVQDYLAARKADVSPAIIDRLLAVVGLDGMLAALRPTLERLAQGETLTADDAADPAFATDPDPADGLFAAAVESRIEIGDNKIDTALLGVAVLGSRGHVMADANDDAPLLIDVSGNRVSDCALGGFQIVPELVATTSFTGNHVLGCGDLGAPEAAAATAAPSGMGSAIARFQGSGSLIVHGNIFQGNGHGHPSALLHEVMVDWRGEVILRGNTIHHRGGGLGGVALLLVLEPLDAQATAAATLVKRLAQSPVLAVEPPPAPAPKTGIIRAPSRALLQPSAFVFAPVAASRYLIRAAERPALSLADYLVRRPLRPLPPPPPPDRRSAHVEGNHVVANGPSLLLLAAGTAVVSAMVVGNQLRSDRAGGAVYLRHTDATVFTGNHCECVGSVNVVVLRPDAAPVTVTGNIILGQQPVAQTDPSVIKRRSDIKIFVKQEISREFALSAPAAEVADPAPAPAPEGGVFAVVNRSAAPPPFSTLLSRIAINPALLNEVAKAVKSPLPAIAVPPPAPPPPNPASFSLVILGGTRVVAAGNATSAGALTLDADQSTELNV